MVKEKVKKQYLNGLERILKIDYMISHMHYPSVEDFARETEVSIPTINRDLRDLRMKFGAEDILQYDRIEKGFYYTRPSFRIPAMLTSEKQIIAAIRVQISLDILIHILRSRQITQIQRRVSAFNDLLWADAVSHQILPQHIQNRGFSAAPDTGEDFHQRNIPIFFEFIQIMRPYDHNIAPLQCRVCQKSL